MSQTTPPDSAHRRHSPVREVGTPHLRAIRKELLLLRSDVERTEFLRARAEIRSKFAHLSWMKLLVPGFGGARRKGSGRGVNATISDWVIGHPLVSSLASLFLAKPLRATVAAGAKPILKWGALGAAAWAGFRVWSQLSSKKREARDEREETQVETSDE